MARVGRAELIISKHAIHRYQERVANVCEDAARIALSSPAIACAANFGAPYVKLGTGQRVVIEDSHVITVLPAEHPAHRTRPLRTIGGEYD